MTSIAVKDLKRPRELRATLERAREVVVTKDGRPFAIMIGVEPEGADETLREVRRALFSTAVRCARRRATQAPISTAEIQAEVEAQRGHHTFPGAGAGGGGPTRYRQYRPLPRWRAGLGGGRGAGELRRAPRRLRP